MAQVIQKPIRPGTVIRFVGETIPNILSSVADVVAVTGTHPWGPENTPTAVVSPLDFDSKFGSVDSPLRRAVILALNGQGAPAGGGAGTVVVNRMVGAAGARASVTITNVSSATPALRLRGKYDGDFGERVSYVTEDDPSGGTNDRLKLYLDGALQETFVYTQTDIANLGAQINSATTGSRLVDADGPGGAAIVTGTALTATNPADPDGPNLTGGDDGSTLIGADYTDMMAALQNQRFSAIAIADLTDDTIRGTLVTWVVGLSTANRPVMLVVGGGSSDSISTAVTRSAGINNENVINVGVGTYTHDLFPGRVFTTSELAPMVAGALVYRGLTKSLTFAKFAGLSPVGTTSPTNAQIESAIQNGVVVFSYATSANAKLQAEMGVTTYTTKAAAAKPYEVFSDARMVRVMQLYVRGMKEWGDEEIIGGMVNQDSRDAVRAEARRRQDELDQAGILVPATAFVNVPVPSDPQLADSIPYDFGWQFARTANFVFGNGRIR